MLEKNETSSYSIVSDSLWPHGLYGPWSSPGQNTGVSSCSLLQGSCNPGIERGLPHCRQILYQLSHKGSPRILERVAYTSPVDLPYPGVKPGSPGLQMDSLPAELSGEPFACSEWDLIPYLKPTISFLPQINFEKTCMTFVGKLHIQ